MTKIFMQCDIKGYVTFYELLKGGHRGRKILSDHNIVTTLGREKVAALLTGESTAFVTHMAIGDGGAPQDDLLTPIVPVLSNSALVNELDRSPVTPVRVGQVLTFTSTFLTASLGDPDFIDPANKVYNEAGLFTADNVLFARKTFPSVPFAPLDRIGVVGEWEIEIL
jgi:hypothetical protein